jgi:hypothetical protein
MVPILLSAPFGPSEPVLGQALENNKQKVGQWLVPLLKDQVVVEFLFSVDQVSSERELLLHNSLPFPGITSSRLNSSS